MSKEKMFYQRVPITRRHFLKLSGASAGLMLAPTVLPKISWSAGKKTLKYRDYADVMNFDPAFSGNVIDENIFGCIHEKLIVYKPGKTWEWQLQAAESIKEMDPTHIKFTLKPGIMFTNGFGEMTAEDVKFSFERIADPAMKSPMKGDWALLDHVETTGKYSGVIVMKKPFRPLWLTTLPYNSGNILSKKAILSVGGKFKGVPPCFSGPYVIKEWKPKQHTLLVRNELWKGPKPDFDEIQIFPIDDEKTAEIAFEAGDVDITRISIASLEKYKASPPPNSTVKKYPSLYYAWLGINMDNPKLKDIRIRKAVQMAVDVPSIMDAAYFGAAEPSTGIIAPGLLGHREKNLIPPEANINGARKLLAEAGYPNGISVTMDVLNKAANVTAAQVIQAFLAQAGIQVEINLHESGAFWTLGDEKSGNRWKNIQLILNRFSMAPDPFWATQWFTQEQVGVWNWERFRSNEFDELHKKAIGESDQAKRARMYEKMQDIMEESGGYRFITHEATPVIYRNTIVPALRPDGLPLLRYFKKA